MHCFGRTFKPSRFATLLTILGVAFWLWFSWFEYQRMQYKINLQTSYHQQSQLPPLSAQEINQLPLAKLKFRRIHLNGHYDTAHCFLLDNQIYQHHIGHHVITPLTVQNDNQRFLVDRGWQDCLAQQPITSSNPASVDGIIYIREKQPMLLNSNHLLGDRWPRLLQRIDFPAIQTALNAPTHTFVILLDPSSKNGFTRDWKSVTIVPYARHLGYAIQFLAIALTILIIYVCLNLKKPDDQAD